MDGRRLADLRRIVPPVPPGTREIVEPFTAFEEWLAAHPEYQENPWLDIVRMTVAAITSELAGMFAERRSESNR